MLKRMFALFVFGLMAGSIACTAGESARVKEFSEYRCKVVLHGTKFVWYDHMKMLGGIAAWGDRAGTKVVLVVTKFPGAKLDTKGFDEGLHQAGTASKISGENITFKGISCYQVHVRLEKDGGIATIRTFVANGYAYMLHLFGSPLPVAERDKLESLFSAFELMDKPTVVEEKVVAAGMKQSASSGDTSTYFVGNMMFSVGKVWQATKTTIANNKLLLIIPDGKGGNRGIIRVDVGLPSEPGLAANTKTMESRFGGKSTSILDGTVTRTDTTATSVKTPRHIFTAVIDGRLYVVFVAADNPELADAASESIQKTLKISSNTTAESGSKVASVHKTPRHTRAAPLVTVASDGPNTARTRMMGFGLGGKDYEDFSDVPGGALLVGFEAGYGQFVGKPVIHSLRPIYRTAKGEMTGKQYGTSDNGRVVVKAKPGYAVGGITVKAGLGIDGFSVTFMRINGDVLDPSDSYTSDWIGGRRGGREPPLAGTGVPVVGVFGKLNPQRVTCGIGLVLAEGVPKDGVLEKQ